MNPKGKKIVIHTCCAICGSEIAERIKNGYEPVIFFCNPNIHDREEYRSRRDAAKKLADDLNIPFFEDKYDRGEWLEKAGTMPDEPEGGKRCEECFKLRLGKSAEFAKEKNIDNLTTTLAASPYKNEYLIVSLGESISRESGLEFIDPLSETDKNQAWKKALAKAKEAGYYRQRYCGCEFSDKSRSDK